MALLDSYVVAAGTDFAATGDLGSTDYSICMSFVLAAEKSVTDGTLQMADGRFGGGSDPAADITIRIETDNAGVPSGTLAHANATATIADFSDQNMGNRAFSFTPFNLAAGTYHIVASIPAQADNVYYAWWTKTPGDDATVKGMYKPAAGSWTDWAPTRDCGFVINGGEPLATGSTRSPSGGVAISNPAMY